MYTYMFSNDISMIFHASHRKKRNSWHGVRTLMSVIPGPWDWERSGGLHKWMFFPWKVQLKMDEN